MHGSEYVEPSTIGILVPQFHESTASYAVALNVHHNTTIVLLPPFNPKATYNIQ